jgi:cellulose synthase/poly-beta-1,6-N-acetylglucosamine synthase-like glycosyltransferase
VSAPGVVTRAQAFGALEARAWPQPLASRLSGPCPHLYACVFGAWLLSIIWFESRLLSLLRIARTPVEWDALAFFVVFTQVAWLYGFYNVGVVLFAILYRRQPRRLEASTLGVRPPAVALLYTTCNDFVEASAQSCVEQAYPEFTVYLLDDSTHLDFRSRVDRFAARYPDRVRVVRRPDRRGFKAGNLNHGLAQAATDEPFFALVDADEVLPADFLRRTVPLLLADGRRGFVQANHRSNPANSSALAKSLGVGVDVHWRWYQPLRNRYGFVMLLGHGALIRRVCWEAVGGFPEVVSEDLAFALRVREAGWRGHFAEDVVCLEDFPQDVRAFRVRHMKWTRGTCELLRREAKRLVMSRKISLVEKLDILVPTLNLGLSLVYFLFVIDSNLVLPALFGRPQTVTVAMFGRELVLPGLRMAEGFAAVYGIDFYLITVMTLLAPVLCFVIDLRSTPLRMLRFLARSTALYSALGPLSCVGVLLYLATGRAIFHVTADRSAGETHAAEAEASWLARLHAGWRRLVVGSHPDGAPVQAFEAACGVVLGVACVLMFQVSYLGVAFANVLLPVMHHVRWEQPALRALSGLPLALILAGVLFGGLTLAGVPTALFGFGVHF